MGFRAVYCFRPGYVQPIHGVTSETGSYRALYAIAVPLYPVLRSIAPRYVTTTEAIGRAMINVARRGWPTAILESDDINNAAVA